VSILDLKNQLPDVFTKTETILLMFMSLAEIDLMRGGKREIPKELDEEACAAAKARIESVAKDIGISTAGLEADMFRVKLVEKEAAWTEDPNDRKLADRVNAQLELLHAILYPEEENDYKDLEEMYRAEELTKPFVVKCEKCGKESVVETEYQGVLEVEQRSMGTESTHVWWMSSNCPFCKRDLQVEYTRWEYPQYWVNDDELEASGCQIVEETSQDKNQSTLVKAVPTTPALGPGEGVSKLES
jgi:hypothetical protein